MKARLMLRTGFSDAQGSNCGYEYASAIVDIPESEWPRITWMGSPVRPQVIGVEWLPEAEQKGGGSE